MDRGAEMKPKYNQNDFEILTEIVEGIDNDIVTGKKHYYKTNLADKSRVLLFTLDEVIRAILDKSLIGNQQNGL